MIELNFLDPDRCLWKQVDTIEVIRVHVCDDDVGDLFRLDPESPDRPVGSSVVGDPFVLLEALRPVEPGIDQDRPPARSLSVPGK